MQTIKANAMLSAASKITLVCLFFFGMGRACADEARTVLEKAIQAHGGADKLERTKRGRIKALVNGKSNGESFQWKWEETFDLPGRFHWTVEETAGGKTVIKEYLRDGTRGWGREGKNPFQKAHVPQAEPLEEHWHAIPAQLLLFSRSKDTELKFLGEEMKDGRRLAILSVRSPRTTADLYFDRATGLLARAVRPVPGLAEVNIAENTYDDYKQIQGVQYPMHSKATNPKFSLDIKVASIEFLDKIDPGEFAKPVEADAPQTPSPPEQPDSSSDETPARWDMRLVVATLAVGAFVAVVWLLVRGSKTGKPETGSGEPGA